MSLLSYDHAWAAFKRHTLVLEDQSMRERINCLIDYAAVDPYAIEIRYHNACWLNYVRSYQKMSEDDKLPRLHNVNLREAQSILFDHIRTVIFEEQLRSLQSLLKTTTLSYLGTASQHPLSGHPLSKISWSESLRARSASNPAPRRTRATLSMTRLGVVHISRQRSPPSVSALSNWYVLLLSEAGMTSSQSNSPRGRRESRS